jgi:hypothetical protein
MDLVMDPVMDPVMDRQRFWVNVLFAGGWV